MLLQEAIKFFLDDYQNPLTRHAYEQVLIDLSKFIGTARPLDKIAPADLVLYAHEIDARPFAPATRAKYIKSVKIFFNWCVRLELISRSPASVIKTRRPAFAIEREKAMTEAEFEAILDYVKWKPRDYALVLFLADTGCRAGGAAGLKVGDLSFLDHTAIVTEKGEKTRQVAYGRECAVALQAWLLRQPRIAGPFVFSRSGQRIKPSSISQVVERACLRVLGRSRGAHSLRHRKGHQMADAGVAVTVAARVLGHSDPAITLMYYPSDWGRAKEVVEELSYRPKRAPVSNVIRFPKTSTK